MFRLLFLGRLVTLFEDKPEFVFWLPTVPYYTFLNGLQRSIFLWLGPGARHRGLSAPIRVPKLLTAAFRSGLIRHPSVPGASGSISRLSQPRLSRRKRQLRYPPEHAGKQPTSQMALRQKQPVVASMFSQPVLQARQGPVSDPLWQHQPSPHGTRNAPL